MKIVFRIIGFLTVLLVLAAALLFYLDEKSLLSGQIGALVRTLHILWKQARIAIEAFGKESGITNDALDFLQQGVGKLNDLLGKRGSSAQDGSGIMPGAATPTPSPVIIYITPEPGAVGWYGG